MNISEYEYDLQYGPPYPTKTDPKLRFQWEISNTRKLNISAEQEFNLLKSS